MKCVSFNIKLLLSYSQVQPEAQKKRQEKREEEVPAEDAGGQQSCVCLIWTHLKWTQEWRRCRCSGRTIEETGLSGLDYLQYCWRPVCFTATQAKSLHNNRVPRVDAIFWSVWRMLSTAPENNSVGVFSRPLFSHLLPLHFAVSHVRPPGVRGVTARVCCPSLPIHHSEPALFTPWQGWNQCRLSPPTPICPCQWQAWPPRPEQRWLLSASLSRFINRTSSR